ncbi:hypothetical protein P879_10614 [Paragonimus westermani]|uniref:C3H1-type domain-containing protein n=1 Tax=Paragonimus westermani TaxID=34504 RepID=A0A8T0D3G4_9TREM|nr:hypothetical protein P879_10614 [Paragonimus westermani]
MSRTSVCQFYQAGYCRNGVACSFGHPAVRCRTFTSTGWCPYGYNCYFWHNCSQARVPTTTFKRKPCIFFANNQCKYGDGCAFSHDLQSHNHSSAMTLAEYRSSKILSPTYLQNPNAAKRPQPVHEDACVSEGRFSTPVTPPIKITSLRNTVPMPKPNEVVTHFRMNESNEADIFHLRTIEIKRMLTSFPADKLCEVQPSGDVRTFSLRFSSTDPDWLRSLLTDEQDSRETGSFASTQHQTAVETPVFSSLAQQTDVSHPHPNLTLGSQGQQSCSRSNLRDAEISAELFAESDQTVNSPSNSCTSEVEFDRTAATFQSVHKPAPDYPDDKTPEWVESVRRLEINLEGNDGQSANPSGFPRSRVIPFESVSISKVSQTLSLSELRLSDKVGTLVPRRLSAMLHCTRCKLSFMWAFSLHGGQPPTITDTTLPSTSRLRSLPPHSVNCARCKQPMGLVFQANIAHAFANHVGSFHLNGCVADDIPPKLSEVVLLCTECNQSVKVAGLEPGRPSRKRCYNCHSLLGVEFKDLKLEAAKESDHSCMLPSRFSTLKDFKWLFYRMYNE